MSAKEGVIFATSSYLSSAEYDAEERLLTITFHSGAVYGYQGVSWEVWRGLTSAPSAGQYFHRHIKGRYGHEDIR